MTSIGWTLFVALSFGYLTFTLWAVVLEADILSAVNSRLPQDKQFPLIGNHRTFELWRQYKILFPDGRLHTQSTRLFIGGAVSLFGAILTFYWFHLSVRHVQ
jgi:hypothetical protein